jgi:hypothetical protein
MFIRLGSACFATDTPECLALKRGTPLANGSLAHGSAFRAQPGADGDRPGVLDRRVTPALSGASSVAQTDDDVPTRAEHPSLGATHAGLALQLHLGDPI